MTRTQVVIRRYLAAIRRSVAAPGVPKRLPSKTGSTMKQERFNGSRVDWQSLAMPAVLILTGLALVMPAGLGVLSLAGIQNLWPLAALLIGLTELAGPTESGRRLQETDTETKHDV